MTTYTGANRVLRTQEVADLLSVTRTTIWRWHSSGHFPAPRLLGSGSNRPFHGWLESDVAEWLAARPRLGGDETTTNEVTE
jgi:excisionase family DNA binding protein